MGFESSFILYRKYNTKASEKEIKSIIKKYAAENKKMDYSESKKSDEEYAKDIPLILDPAYGDRTSVYDKKTKQWIDKSDHSVVGQRKSFNYILASDGSNLDELLYWHFCSNFNCLCDEFNLGHGIHKNEVIIDIDTAKMMLQACNYLLSGKWSDEVEEILDNKWIKVFAEGNSSDSYWPYVYRNNKKALNDIEYDERDSIKYTLVNTKNALEAYLNAETSGHYDNDTELILVYSISY